MASRGRQGGLDVVGLDLSGVDLSGGVFQESWFTDARLVGAKLIGVDLYRSDAEGADFSGADPTGDSLVRANLDDAVCRGGGSRRCGPGQGIAVRGPRLGRVTPGDPPHGRLAD
ncbi:pentapeptide repeat-containing protein [Streptomyces sp. G35A]